MRLVNVRFMHPLPTLETFRRLFIGSNRLLPLSETLTSGLRSAWFRTTVGVEEVRPFAFARGRADLPRSYMSTLSEEKLLVTDFFQPPSASASNLCLVVLNYNLPAFLFHIWDRASLQVCADGGANRIYDLVPTIIPSKDPDLIRVKYRPNIIRGDLDSLRHDVRRFYEQHGVDVHDLSDDQDTTDLEKCLNYVMERVKAENKMDNTTVLVAGAVGGRLDHTLAHLNALHKYPDLPLVLMGEGNLARLITPGRTRIKVDRSIEGPQCGLIPLAGPVTASSTGLQWNLDNTRLDFQGLVSSSNLLNSDEVVVDVDGPVLWTTELQEQSILAEMNG